MFSLFCGVYTLNKYSEFMASLDCGEWIWNRPTGKSLTICFLCHIVCDVPLSLCHKSGLRCVKRKNPLDATYFII